MRESKWPPYENAGVFVIYIKFGILYYRGLKDKDLEVESQKRINIYFRGKKVGIYVPDKIVNKKIIIELKSKPFLTREDQKQFWLYLKGSEYKLGLLINFSPNKLEIKRRVYDEARQNVTAA